MFQPLQPRRFGTWDLELGTSHAFINRAAIACSFTPTTLKQQIVDWAKGGIYLMSGVMGLWAASTIREHNTLIFLMAATVFVGGLGRVLSISKVGLPEPHALWLAYVISELVIPVILVAGQYTASRRRQV